jgi:RNA polymerase sigma-70 factor (ECF subfamily)
MALRSMGSTMNLSDTDQLVQRAQSGDRFAQQALLVRHRERLKRMVASLLDPRLAPRIDASDIVQDALTIAHDRLPAYLRSPPVAFYPWLRAIAKEIVIDVHRKHIRAQRRSVVKEDRLDIPPNDFSASHIADRLASRELTPSRDFSRQEMTQRVKRSLDLMPPADRELLTMRFVEQLSVPEIAVVLEISENAARARVRRAIERLGRTLIDPKE